MSLPCVRPSVPFPSQFWLLQISQWFRNHRNKPTYRRSDARLYPVSRVGRRPPLSWNAFLAILLSRLGRSPRAGDCSLASRGDQTALRLDFPCQEFIARGMTVCNGHNLRVNLGTLVMIEEIGHDLTRREYVPISRAAQLLGVSRKTVYNWIKKGKVEWFRTPGGRIRIFVDSLGRRDPDDEILYR